MKPSISSRILSVIPVLVIGCLINGRAEMIEMTNGDHYRGTVLSMNANSIEFQSEVLGRITIPRSKVANISLHDLFPKRTANTEILTNNPAVIVTRTNAITGATASAGAVAPGSQADAVLRELRKQGVDPKLIDQVQEQIFGKSSPEAAQKFNELMGGLLTGQLSVDDIRKQAQTSINEIKNAKKELGGDAGDMLDSYLAILEKFMQESGNDSAPPAPAKPAPGK